MSTQKPQGAEFPPRICVDTAVDGLLSNTGLVWIRAYHEKEFDKENDYLYLSEQEHQAQITSLEAMLEMMAGALREVHCWCHENKELKHDFTCAWPSANKALADYEKGV